MPRAGRRVKILRVAAQLFANKGYDRTGVRDVAERVGMLSGSLYAHFASKEEMLFELISRAVDDAIQALSPVVDSNLAPPDKVREALRVSVRQISRSNHLSKILIQWRLLGPSRRDRIRAKRAALGQLWQRIIDEGITSGYFSDEDPMFARILILSVANWTRTWFRSAGRMSADEVADRLTRVILTGLSRRAGTIMLNSCNEKSADA